MGFRVVYRKRALNDLSRLVRRIARDGPSEAVRFGEALVNEAEQLSFSPRRGIAYDLRREIYSIPFPPYRLYYRVLEKRQTIEVLKIWHGARERPPRL